MPRMDKLSTYRTTVVATGGRISVTYVSTLIVDATPETVTLDSGGWRTVTTKRKMNQAARQFGLGYGIIQRKGEWFVELASGLTLPFADNMTFKREGM